MLYKKFLRLSYTAIINFPNCLGKYLNIFFQILTISVSSSTSLISCVLSAIKFYQIIHLSRSNVNVNHLFFRFFCRYRFACWYLVCLPSLHHFVILLPGYVVPHPAQISAEGRQIWTAEQSQRDHAAYQSHHGTSGDGRRTGVRLRPTDRHPELFLFS